MKTQELKALKQMEKHLLKAQQIHDKLYGKYGFGVEKDAIIEIGVTDLAQMINDSIYEVRLHINNGYNTSTIRPTS